MATLANFKIPAQFPARTHMVFWSNTEKPSDKVQVLIHNTYADLVFTIVLTKIVDGERRGNVEQVRMYRNSRKNEYTTMDCGVVSTPTRYSDYTYYDQKIRIDTDVPFHSNHLLVNPTCLPDAYGFVLDSSIEVGSFEILQRVKKHLLLSRRPDRTDRNQIRAGAATESRNLGRNAEVEKIAQRLEKLVTDNLKPALQPMQRPFQPMQRPVEVAQPKKKKPKSVDMSELIITPTPVKVRPVQPQQFPPGARFTDAQGQVYTFA